MAENVKIKILLLAETDFRGFCGLLRDFVGGAGMKNLFMRIFKHQDSPYVLERILHENVEASLAMSATACFLEALILASTSVYYGLIVTDSRQREWFQGNRTAYLFLLVISVVTHLLLRKYKKNYQAEKKFLQTLLSLFCLTLLIFGVYISVKDQQMGYDILAFITMAIWVFCVFVFRPVTLLLISTLTFALFFILDDRAGGLTIADVTNGIILMLSIQIIGISRYILTGDKFAAEEKMSQLNRSLRRISLHDELTGLKNRNALRQDYELFAGKKISVMMTDLDDFKFYNDSFGHLIGDKILKECGDALKRVFGPGNCYRYGGDEFLIITTDDPETFRQRIEGLKGEFIHINAEGKRLYPSVSGGYVYALCSEEQDIRMIIKKADAALYEAKNKGKNCFVSGVPDSAEKHGAEENGEAGSAGSVTGLPDIKNFRMRAQIVLGNAAGRQEFAVVYFNIVNFRSINAQFGYSGGDGILKTEADILREVFPSSLIAHLGNDNFIILTDRNKVEDRIREVEDRIRQNYETLSITIKAGVYVFRREVQPDISVACDAAGFACRSIQNQEEVYWKFYDQELEIRMQKNRYIETSLDTAIENQYIKLCYFPVINVKTRTICGEEALARWEDPVYGQIPAAEFISVLERSHLIHRLDSHIIRKVCSEYSERAAGRGAGFTISVNLSRQDFMVRDMTQVLDRATEEYGVGRQQIPLEISEASIADDYQEFAVRMNEIKEAGYSVWLDAFGSGHSSLQLLQHGKFDGIKTDMHFLDGIFTSRHASALLSGIIELSRKLDLQMLVVGVETEEELQILHDMGCDKAEGYLFLNA